MPRTQLASNLCVVFATEYCITAKPAPKSTQKTPSKAVKPALKTIQMVFQENKKGRKFKCTNRGIHGRRTPVNANFYRCAPTENPNYASLTHARATVSDQGNGSTLDRPQCVECGLSSPIILTTAMADEQTHAPITATVPNGHMVAKRAAFDTGIMGFSADEADTFCAGFRMLSQ